MADSSEAKRSCIPIPPAILRDWRVLKAAKLSGLRLNDVRGVFLDIHEAAHLAADDGRFDVAPFLLAHDAGVDEEVVARIMRAFAQVGLIVGDRWRPFEAPS